MSAVRLGRWTAVLCVIAFLGGIMPGTAAADSTGNPQRVLTGTMRYLQLEGGCWVLEADDGERYQLVGDPSLLARLRVDGLQVTAVVESAPNMMGKCMVGRWLRLIRLVRTGEGATAPP